MFNFMKKNLRNNKYKTFQIRQIPAKLWAKFKMQCKVDGVTLNDGLIDLITEYSDGKISYIDEE